MKLAKPKKVLGNNFKQLKENVYNGNLGYWLKYSSSQPVVVAKRTSKNSFNAPYLYLNKTFLRSDEVKISLKFSNGKLHYNVNTLKGQEIYSSSYDLESRVLKEIKNSEEFFIKYLISSDNNQNNKPLLISTAQGLAFSLVDCKIKKIINGEYIERTDEELTKIQVGGKYTAKELSILRKCNIVTIYKTLKDNKKLIKDDGQKRCAKYFITEDNISLFETKLSKLEKSIQKIIRTIDNVSDINDGISPNKYFLLPQLLEKSNKSKVNTKLKKAIKEYPDKIIQIEGIYAIKGDIIEDIVRKGIKKNVQIKRRGLSREDNIPKNIGGKENKLENSLRKRTIFKSTDKIPKINENENYSKKYFSQVVLGMSSTPSTNFAKKLIDEGYLTSIKEKGKKQDKITGESIISFISKFSSIQEGEQGIGLKKDGKLVNLFELQRQLKIDEMTLSRTMEDLNIIPNTKGDLPQIKSEDANRIIKYHDK
ncbi:hypothetical protein CMI39_03945 [Candidatus Pacearchaeota archaeon]|jgi:hypothetical protein|nr:hypothetical protein [Candidatus Pacearchaeota archaeon]|tara:strand:+ start:4168 stop:5607 length:1440 start_codon:yes stop_codon:yes gene_type:complete